LILVKLLGEGTSVKELIVALDIRSMLHRRATSAFFARATVIVTCTIAVFFPIASASRAFAEIKIGIIGDQTGAADIDKSFSVLRQGVDAINAAAPDVVVHTGDLIESTQTLDEIRARFGQATAILGQLRAPWYLAAGDHDVSPPDFVQSSPDHSRETLFETLYANLNPRVESRLYYSFDVDKYHFVALYSTEALDTDPRWGNIFFSGISDEQYDWLANDLAAHATTAKGVVVFLHQPLWYVWSNWDRVHQLLAKYPTKAVIAGHFHYNQVDSRIDNIAYRVVGATGGDTKHGSANAGDLQHVTLLTIKDDGTTDFRMVPLAPYTQISWTSRQIMDRVQAQDLLLGNMYSFPSDSPVYLQNGELVAACGKTDPAKLNLIHLGNADAAPVDAAIDINAPNMVLAPSFGVGMCAQVSSSTSCRLNPSAGVAVSNNSEVEPPMFGPPTFLWSATVTALNPPPSPGTPITAALTLSFIAENQRFSISHSGVTVVKACN
jgi:3',5'-cyclic AMP phosphodiesterase CpdA